MKKILFDFVTLQCNNTYGCVFYTHKIFEEISNNDVEVYGLFNGNWSINKRVDEIVKQQNITLINICDEDVSETINTLNIQTFFIGCAQNYHPFDLRSIKCNIVIVCHDVNDLSRKYFDILQSKPLKIFTERYLVKEKKTKTNTKLNIKLFIKILLYPIVLLRRYYIKQKNAEKQKNKKCSVPYENLKELIKQTNVFVVTVSEYSKYSFQYFLGIPKNKIEVFYSPTIYENFEENTEKCVDISQKLKNKKYFLMISVDRGYKNAMLLLEQWEKFCLATNYEYHCVLIGNKIKANVKNSIILKEVNSDELAYLYKNAFAFVFASFTEGFGYPPIESAAYGTPCICANVTSIPEICGDMPIYFSPFYPEDLFRAMIQMTKEREVYVEKAKQRFLEVNQRQKQDLQKIVEFILGDKKN